MIFPDLESAVNAQEAASHCSNGQDAAPATELKTPPLKPVGTPRIQRVYRRAIRRARICRFPLAVSIFTWSRINASIHTCTPRVSRARSYRREKRRVKRVRGLYALRGKCYSCVPTELDL